MAPKFKISDEVRAVLSAAEIGERSVKLTAQFDRATYLQVDKVLKSAGGKWNRKAGVHLFDRDPREILGLAVETGEAVNMKQQLQAFYTPAPLAARMAELADIQPGHLVLEPSAGMGALCEAMNEACREATIVCCDVDPVAVDHLRRQWEPLVGSSMEPADFLKVDPVAIYDRIVMNPPFTNGQDIAHVTHALDFLKPGGLLVALTAPGWRFAQTKPAAAFRDLVEELDGDVEEVPEGTFHESGTEIRTVLVMLRKPEARRAGAAPEQLAFALEAA